MIDATTTSTPQTNNKVVNTPRKQSLTDASKHHLHQVHEVLHNMKESVKESYAHHQEEKREKRPQDGKTNPLE